MTISIGSLTILRFLVHIYWNRISKLCQSNIFPLLAKKINIYIKLSGKSFLGLWDMVFFKNNLMGWILFAMSHTKGVFIVNNNRCMYLQKADIG